MKKETLADKLAKKAFFGADVQKSWNEHMQVFGPILEPAFVDDYQARVHLTAALNLISNRKIAQASPKFKQLQKHIVTEADKAAFLFLTGLLCEMAEDQEQMVKMYAAANEFGHRLYLPYMKVAKYCMEERIYDKAEENFRTAIDCLSEGCSNDQEKLALNAAYTNAATCLINMHRYDEAEDLLAISRDMSPEMPGRAMVEGIFYALRGDETRAKEYLDRLEAELPELYPMIKERIDKIFARTEPNFFAIPVAEGAVDEFWCWFAEYGDDLKSKLDRQEYEEALTPVAEHLQFAFPFFEERPYVALGQNEKGYVLVLRTYYAIGSESAYGKLMDACPESVKAHWQFAVEH